METDKSLVGKVVKKTTGVSAKASASAKSEVGVTGHHSDGISSSRDRNFEDIREIYNNSESMTVNKINEYLDENHPGLNDDQREKFMERMKYNQWAKEFQHELNSYYSKELETRNNNDSHDQ